MTDEPIRPMVLFVDDEENILKALVRLTIDEGFDTMTANSGAAGLKALETMENVALIVSDQRMPVMNGAEFLKLSQELVPDAVRILLTGYSDITAAADAINKGGASRYLTKPWQDEELLQTLRSAVDNWQLAYENRRLQAIVKAQNEELSQWNDNLKSRVLQQTTAMRKKADDLNDSLIRLKQNYSGIIDAFCNLVEMRGQRMQQHSRNVAQLSIHAARECGMQDSDLETLRVAALLHDIGEIGIPDHILAMPPERMLPDDFRVYSQHPVRAQLAIDHICDLRQAGEIIRSHHENYDGSGYPDRLAGESIPLGARILAYADQLDRAVAGGDTAEQALARVELTLGSRLDPALQKQFRKVIRHAYISMPELSPDATVELELQPAELKPGMILNRNLYSGTGMLLLNRGATLDTGMIESINRYYELDRPLHGVFALVKRAEPTI